MALLILCFDLDGTLVDGKGRIHPQDAALLVDPEPQAVFTPATGRPLGSVRHTFNQNGLFVGQKLPFPLILQNGSILFAGGEKLVSFLPFDRQAQSDLIDLARQHPQVTFLFMGLEDVHVEHPSSFGQAAIERWELEVSHFERRNQSVPYGKLMCLSRERRELERIARQVRDLPVETAFCELTALDITPKGVDKGSGLSRLRHELGLEEGLLFVAGDGENDLPLMRPAKMSFAPSNAQEAVKKEASVILDVSKDGLLEPMLHHAASITAGRRCQ